MLIVLSLLCLSCSCHMLHGALWVAVTSGAPACRDCPVSSEWQHKQRGAAIVCEQPEIKRSCKHLHPLLSPLTSLKKDSFIKAARINIENITIMTSSVVFYQCTSRPVIKHPTANEYLIITDFISVFCQVKSSTQSRCMTRVWMHLTAFPWLHSWTNSFCVSTVDSPLKYTL